MIEVSDDELQEIVNDVVCYHLVELAISGDVNGLSPRIYLNSIAGPLIEDLVKSIKAGVDLSGEYTGEDTAGHGQI